MSELLSLVGRRPLHSYSHNCLLMRWQLQEATCYEALRLLSQLVTAVLLPREDMPPTSPPNPLSNANWMEVKPFECWLPGHWQSDSEVRKMPAPLLLTHAE